MRSSTPRDHFIVFKHVVEMLDDRGYMIPDDQKWILDEYRLSEEPQLVARFMQKYSTYEHVQFAINSPMDGRYSKQITEIRENGESTTYDHIISTAFITKQDSTGRTLSISTDTVRNVIYKWLELIGGEQSFNHNLHGLMIISEFPLTPSALKEITQKFATYGPEIFFYSNLIINPSKHFLVPRHELLTTDQSRDFLVENKLNFDELPKMLTTDPMARYFNATEGDIFRIYRDKSIIPVVDKSRLYYRGVIKLREKKSKKTEMQKGK